MPEFQNNYVPEKALDYVVATNLKATRLAQSGAMEPSAMEVGPGFVNVQPFGVIFLVSFQITNLVLILTLTRLNQAAQ